MKTSLSNLLKSRLVGAILVTVLGMMAAGVAWSAPSEARVKLGGTWVGRMGDITWTATYAPDASGQNAVTTLQWMTVSTEFQYMLGAVGAETMSMVSGYVSVTTSNTASGKLVWYMIAPGKASTTAPVAGQVKAIAVMTSDWSFTSATTAEGLHNLKIYLPNAQGSLLPEDGILFYNVTFDKVLHQKIF